MNCQAHPKIWVRTKKPKTNEKLLFNQLVGSTVEVHNTKQQVKTITRSQILAIQIKNY